MKTLLLLSFLPLLFSVAWSNPLCFKQQDLQCDMPSTSARFDCHPDRNPHPSCETRGCCWNKTVNSPWENGLPKVGQGITPPYCYFPKNYNGYSFKSVKQTDYGYRAVMSRCSPSGWPRDVQTLTMDVWLESAKTLRFKVTHYSPTTLLQTVRK